MSIYMNKKNPLNKFIYFTLVAISLILLAGNYYMHSKQEALKETNAMLIISHDSLIADNCACNKEKDSLIKEIIKVKKYPESARFINMKIQ